MTIRERRLACGLSLREVSRRSGINPGRLSIIERGVIPTLEEMIAIDDVLKAEETVRRGVTA